MSANHYPASTDLLLAQEHNLLWQHILVNIKQTFNNQPDMISDLADYL